MLKAKLEYIETRVDNSQVIHDLEQQILAYSKPLNFTGQNSVEIEYDKQFETMCLLISQKGKQNPRAMTVLQFYSTLSQVEAQIKAEQKAYKK